MAISFNAASKLAILSAGTTTLSVRDLWSRWVDWWLTSNNSGVAPVAMAQVGGNDIDAGAGTKIPIFVFLQNGWRVRPQEANHTLNVSDGVLLVEGGGDPFVNTIGSYVVRINYQQPVQAITVATGGGAAPSTGPVLYAPTSVTRTIGDDEGGTVDNILALDESSHLTGEVSGQGLDVLVSVSASATDENPSLVRVTGHYAGGAGHQVGIYAYNYPAASWERLGTMLTRNASFQYAVPLTAAHQHPSTGAMQIRFLHDASTYLQSHQLVLDQVQFEKVSTNDAIASDVAAIRAKTDGLNFALTDVKATLDGELVTLGASSVVEVADLVWAHASALSLADRLLLVAKILRNKTVTDPTTGLMTVFDDDGTSVLLQAPLWENANGTQAYRGQGAENRGRLE